MLPKDLKSFPRELLEKEASVSTEKLELPKRLSVADLQKIASEKKVDLPTPGAVNADDYASIAGDLQKIAKAHEQETAQDVLATAAAIVAHQKQGGAKWEAVKGGVGASVRGVQSMIPGTSEYHIRMGAREQAQAARTKHRAKIVGTPEHRAKIEETALKETKAERAAKLRSEAAGRETTREFAQALPGAAIGTGLAVSAPAVLKKDPKRERHITIAK
jgi:uncharacterized membrane protein